MAVPSEDSFIQNAVNFYLNMPPHHASRWTDATLKRIASLFDLKLLSIFHEPLNKEHVSFYSKTKMYSNLNRVFGIRQKSVDLSLKNQALYAASAGLSLVDSLTIAPEKIIGQSVLAIYQK